MSGEENRNTGSVGTDASLEQENLLFTILVLDSNYSIDSALEDFLRVSGYPILVANSSTEALEKTRKFEPGLILLDGELKGMTCSDLLPEILNEYPEAAVILMANRPSVARGIKALTLGAVDFFERPLNFERLRICVERQKEFFDNSRQDEKFWR